MANSCSGRKSKRPDPTVAPVQRDLVTGKFKARGPFQPSAYQERKHKGKAVTVSRNWKPLPASGLIEDAPFDIFGDE